MGGQEGGVGGEKVLLKLISIRLLHRHLTAVTLRDIAIGDLLYRPLVATLISPLSRP